MQQCFVAKGLTKVIWTTKMAIQEKGFRSQAHNELQVADAKTITEQQRSNGAQACITDFGGTSFDTGFPKDGLWELSSTQLWQFYEGGDNWSQVGWIPGGYLRIQEICATGRGNAPEASIILEFGDLAFAAERVIVPRCTVTQPLQIRLADSINRNDFMISLVFFQGGHLQVLFPALPLIMMDPNCNVEGVAGKTIEFSGVFMGEIY